MADLALIPTHGVWFAVLEVDLLIERLRTCTLREAPVQAGRKARARLGVPRRRRPPQPRVRAVPADAAPDRIALPMKYSCVDIAQSVVGVGTLARATLLESGDGEAGLLSIEQAHALALEECGRATRFDSAGKRVVVGQRVLQTTGDRFLGWTQGTKRAPYD